MIHAFQWFQSAITVFFIVLVFDPLQTSDAYLNPSRITRKNLYHLLLSGTKYSNLNNNRNSYYPNYIQTKYFLPRPARRIGSEFLGKRSSALLPINIDEKENDIKDNDNLVGFKGKLLYNFNERENENVNPQYGQRLRIKRRVDAYGNRKIKSLFSYLLKNRDDYFGKRFGYYSKIRSYAPYGYNRDIVGSEFLGKRFSTLPESNDDRVNNETEENADNDENNNNNNNNNSDKEKRNENSDSVSEDTSIKQNPNDLNFDESKRAVGSEFLGKRASDKRALGSEFLGKRALGSEFLGKRALGNEFLGKRALGNEFLGKRALGSEFLGKRALGSEFLGKRALGSEFLGKRALGSEFLGKRALGNEFLGKRHIYGKLNLHLFENKDLNNDENFGKKTLENDFLGKGDLELLKQYQEQQHNKQEPQNNKYPSQNYTPYNTYPRLQSRNPSHYPQSNLPQINEDRIKNNNKNYNIQSYEDLNHSNNNNYGNNK